MKTGEVLTFRSFKTKLKRMLKIQRDSTNDEHNCISRRAT